MPPQTVDPVAEVMMLPSRDSRPAPAAPEISEFLRRMRMHAGQFAEENAGKKQSSPAEALARGVWTFCKSYILEAGFLRGTKGLVASGYQSQTVFWQYLLLHEANRREQ